MEEKFRGRYRIRSARNPNWDYGAPGSYSITACLAGRQDLFGKIQEGKMIVSPIGNIAEGFWLEIPAHFPMVRLGEYVFMPDHLHGIINIENQSVSQETGHCPVSHKHKRFRNQGCKTLSSIVGSYKSIVTKHARQINPMFAWQTRFHDHIIRNSQEYIRISEYIRNNPSNFIKRDKGKHD